MTQTKIFRADDPPIVPTATLLSETTPDGITRSLTVSAAYDFRSHPRNYGIHHTEFQWLVQYRNIGVELRASPRWFLPQNRSGGTDDGSPRLAELTIHSPEPLYEGHEPHSDCSITGGDCYYDDSFAAGARLAEILIADPAGFWAAMEKELSETQTRVLAEKEERRNFS